MLKTILSISGKPGLYKLVSQGKNMLIVESISADKKRFPAYGNEKIISLADIMWLKLHFCMISVMIEFRVSVLLTGVERTREEFRNCLRIHKKLFSRRC